MDPLTLTARRADDLTISAKLVERDLGVDPVHEIRVACRRLNQAIGMLGGLIKKAERKRLRKLTNAIRRIFGDLRDADVLLELLQQWLFETPRTLPEVVAASHLITLLATKRRRESQRVKQTLKQDSTKAMFDEIQALSRTCKALKEQRRQLSTQEEPSQDKEPVEGEAPRPSKASRIERALDKTRAALDKRLAQHPMDTTPEGLEQAHDVRIVFKSYRYAVEAFSEKFSTKERKALIKPFKAVQDSLGQIQDASVLLDHIEAARAILPPERPIRGLEHINLNAGFDALRSALFDYIQARFDTFEATFPQANDSLDRHRNPR